MRDKLAPLAKCAANLNHATVHFDQPLHQAEADTQAAL